MCAPGRQQRTENLAKSRAKQRHGIEVQANTEESSLDNQLPPKNKETGEDPEAFGVLRVPQSNPVFSTSRGRKEKTGHWQETEALSNPIR